jgi:hypothetical protein
LIFRFVVFILALGLFMVPAHATMTYYNGTSSNAQFNTAIITAGIALDGTETFTGSLSGGSYTDPNGILFQGFNNNNGVNSSGDNLAISGTALQQTVPAGIMEISNLPAGTFAFSFHLANANSATGLSYCMEINYSSYDKSANCDNIFSLSSSSDVQFEGVVSTATPISTIWIGPNGGQMEEIQLNDFQIGTQAPESQSLLLMGTGLLGLGLLKRRIHRTAAVPSAQS